MKEKKERFYPPPKNETPEEKFERKMAYIRKHFGLNTYEEVEEALKKMKPFNIGYFTEPLSDTITKK